MHPFNGHFPGKPGLAGSPLIFLTKDYGAVFMGQIPSWSQPAEAHLASSSLHPLRLLKGKGHHSLLCQLSDASTPAL